MALSREQKRNLQIITKVGRSMGANERALKASYEAAFAESNATNIKGGDRDSAGVFQQRPSQGWGSLAQVTNVNYAARKFFQSAVPIQNKYGRSKDLAQAVQRSAFSSGSNYQQYAGLSQQLYRALAKNKSGKPVSGGGGSIPPVASKAARKKAGKTARTQAKAGAAPATGDSTQSIADQAQLASDLKYGSETAGIATLLKSARASLKTNSALEKGSARGLKSAVDAAAPQVAKAYAGASSATGVANQVADARLSSLGSAADPYRASTDREMAGATSRIAELAAAGKAELERRKLSAEEGRAYGLRRAQSNYETDVGQLNDRLQQIGKESGQYVAATFGTELGKAKDRGLKSKIANQNAAQRSLDRQARLMTAKLQQQGLSARAAQSQANDWKKTQFLEAGRNARDANGPGKPTKPKLTQAQRNTETNKLNQASALVRQLKGKTSTSQARALLETGGKVGKAPNQLTIPPFPKDYVNSAFDIVYRGGVGPVNAKALRRRGVPVPAGTYKPPKKAPKGSKAVPIFGG